MTETTRKEMPQALKLALDFAPLVAFFAAYKIGGVYWATGTIIALTLTSLVITYLITRSIAKFPLISAVIITIMGSLTFLLQNKTFFYMKPTAINIVFAIILFGGLLTKRVFLKDLLGSAVDMPLSAWRTLTWRWVVFLLVLAGLNEYVWRTMPEATWVNFKVFGLIGLTMVFAIANAPFMAKHMPKDDVKPSADG